MKSVISVVHFIKGKAHFEEYLLKHGFFVCKLFLSYRSKIAFEGSNKVF